MRILVVDDAKKNLISAKDLTLDGHEVETTNSYESAIEMIRGGGFDVLFTDMLMPAEPYALGSKGLDFLGHEMPIGFVLMIAAAQAGIKFGLLATDLNHHNHPMAAAIDWIKGGPVTIGGMTANFVHARLKEDGSKDWQKMLADKG